MASLIKKLRQPRAIGFLGAALIRILEATIRFEIDDQCGLTRGRVEGRVIWLFWHNRVLLMPLLYHRLQRTGPGTVLTSPSGDGEIIAQIVKRFGFEAVRGSSNKRPAAALRELARQAAAGRDVAITPDGPRGPKYQIQPGAVKLAQLTGCPLMAVAIDYSRAWALKTWDGFLIPKPFSRVKVTVAPLIHVPRDADAGSFEAIRLQLKASMKGSP